MKIFIKKTLQIKLFFLSIAILLLVGCQQELVNSEGVHDKKETAEYFMLHPEVEKAYGYTHAVKIGDDIKISGAVSMDNKGNPTAVGDLAQ